VAKGEIIGAESAFAAAGTRQRKAKATRRTTLKGRFSCDGIIAKTGSPSEGDAAIRR
jgi:hypothetical protein